MDLTLNLPLQHSNGLSQEVHEVHVLEGPHGSLKQVDWSVGTADLT